MKITPGILALIYGALVAAPVTARAQSGQTSETASVDAHWTPWLGCWRLAQDNVRGAATSLDEMISMAASTPGVVAPGMTVCVTPTNGNAGVTMTTLADGKAVLEQKVLADGVAHPLADTGCQGTQTSHWSRDGERLFTAVEMSCNDRPTTKASGMTLFARGPAWLDIQAIGGGGDEQVRIRRYERVPGQTTVEARDVPARPLSLEDVTEASATVSSSVLEAALAETQSRWKVDSKALVQLADAGVSPEVIDLVVAQSFPSHFRVDRSAAVAPAYPLPGIAAQYPGPFPYGGLYDPYYYNYYYYSPFAYPYFIGNGRYYINNGTTYVIPSVPNVSVGGGGSHSGPSERGQVINGRGYTRVQPNDGSSQATPAQKTPTSGNPVRSSGSAESSSPSGGSSPSSSGSSSSDGLSGGVSNSGYSGGSGDTGRTAQPR